MKIVLGIILILVLTFGGYLLSFKYKDKKDYFSDFLYFNKKLKNEIEFKQTPISEILKDLNDSSYFNIAIKSYFRQPKTYLFKAQFLNEEEIKFTNDYFSFIGTGDKESQLKFLDICNEKLTEKLKKSEIEYKKYKPLFLKMGFLLGLVIFIIII